ncbi:hypothetical protein E1N66_10425 [Pantoea allii]|nr:hypothetical protein [Pantoea allii]THB84439.1 hypothetical protein E1N66_10425 [Pantoea allii]
MRDLKYRSLKEYIDSQKDKENDLIWNEKKLSHAVKNKDSQEILSILAYLVKKHSYSFELNRDDVLFEYLFHCKEIDEVVIRQLLAMNHRVSAKTLSEILELQIKGDISNDLCELFTQKKSR